MCRGPERVFLLELPGVLMSNLSHKHSATEEVLTPRGGSIPGYRRRIRGPLIPPSLPRQAVQ